MEIRDLMYLEASAAAGNFTRAAKSLGINTATISRRLGRFEDELGLALFERGHAGVRLTTGGMCTRRTFGAPWPSLTRSDRRAIKTAMA